MKMLTRIGLLGAPLMFVMAPQAALAQDELTCRDLQFHERIMEALPQANEACREVVMKDGRPFARFNAEIVSNSGGTVGAKFKRAGGGYTNVLEFQPDPSSTLRIGGQDMQWGDVTPGQQLDIFLPPDRFEIATHSDDSGAVSTAALSAATLPSTATTIPLLGALGGILLAIGAGLSIVRRRMTHKP